MIHGVGAEAYVAAVDAAMDASARASCATSGGASATDTSPPPIPTRGASGGVSHRATALDASVALDAISVAPARSASRENTHRSAPADAGESNLAPTRCVTAPPSPPPTRGTAATTRGAETRAKLDVSRAKKSSVSPAVGSVTRIATNALAPAKRRRTRAAPTERGERIRGDSRRRRREAHSRARRVREPRAAKAHGDGDADERRRRRDDVHARVRDVRQRRGRLRPSRVVSRRREKRALARRGGGEKTRERRRVVVRRVGGGGGDGTDGADFTRRVSPRRAPADDRDDGRRAAPDGDAGGSHGARDDVLDVREVREGRLRRGRRPRRRVGHRLHRDGRAVANGGVAEEFAGGRLDEDERGGDESGVDDARAEENASSEMFAAKRDDRTAAERSHVRRRREDERGLGDAPLGRGRIERRRLLRVEVLERRGGGVRVAKRRRENVDDSLDVRRGDALHRLRVDRARRHGSERAESARRDGVAEIARDANDAAADRDERVGVHGANDGGFHVRERHLLGERHSADAFDGRRLDEDERG